MSRPKPVPRPRLAMARSRAAACSVAYPPSEVLPSPRLSCPRPSSLVARPQRSLRVSAVRSSETNLLTGDAFPAHAHLTVARVVFEAAFAGATGQDVLHVIGELRDDGDVGFLEQVFQIESWK